MKVTIRHVSDPSLTLPNFGIVYRKSFEAYWVGVGLGLVTALLVNL